ncbi:MAG: hypothetical protein ACLFR6_08335 [Salinarchaeum sp.]
MSLRETIASLIEAHFEEVSDAEGAYWYYECDVRVSAAAVSESPPTCPSCGQSMEYERDPPGYGV